MANEILLYIIYNLILMLLELKMVTLLLFFHNAISSENKKNINLLKIVKMMTNLILTGNNANVSLTKHYYIKCNNTSTLMYFNVYNNYIIKNENINTRILKIRKKNVAQRNQGQSIWL